MNVFPCKFIMLPLIEVQFQVAITQDKFIGVDPVSFYSQ